MLRVKTGRKRLKTSTTCECFFEKIEEFSIPSRGIATHGSHASGRWLGVLASVLKSARCRSHMKADHGWSTFFVISRFWNLTRHSLQHFYGARCAFRYFAGDAESIHPDTLEARHQPKGFTIFPKDRWRKSCTMFRSTTYQPVLQPSRMVWFVITLHGPPPLPPYCHHDCPMFFVLSPILSQSVCPWVSACGHSEFQAAFREITPISFSDDEVKVPFAADVDWKFEKGSPFLSIHSCFRLFYHLENSLKHPQSNQQLGLTDDMSWQKYSGMMDHGK